MIAVISEQDLQLTGALSREANMSPLSFSMKIKQTIR